ncbi:MAG: glycosyltransferase family 4 protein [Flavisolibacter sp.]
MGEKMMLQETSIANTAFKKEMQPAKRLSIAYYTLLDPKDRRSWSGITYYLGQTLQKNIGEVDFLGPVKFPWIIHKIIRIFSKLNRILFKKEYNVKYSSLIGWYGARQLKKRMKGKHYDLIVAPAASTELSFLKTSVPIVTVADTTFCLISDYYVKEFKDVMPLSLWEGNRYEQRALSSSSSIIYSSHWARNSAIKDYKIDAAKIHVMPFGANMDYEPGADIIFKKEQNEILTLLYLAVDWERKGGSIAFEAMKALNDKGIKTKLIVCGCIPPADFTHDQMEVIPFLNKNKKDDHDRFVEILSTSHFLILPTRADCSLLVACESNSYGVPAIATQTGGVPDVVLDDINGYCLPYEARGDQYAKIIEDIYLDKERYHSLIKSSRKRFEEQLNWDKWAERFKKIYASQIASVKS